MPFYDRKPQRLKNYDYSRNNAYFLTLCTQNKLHILGDVKNGEMVLNDFGLKVQNHILNMQSLNNVSIDNFVIMPNHIHIILLISRLGTTQGSFPTVSEIIQRFKTVTTVEYINGVNLGKYPRFEKKIWQKSFHDHIIRDKNDYLKIWEYIENNPLKWELDCYYKE